MKWFIRGYKILKKSELSCINWIFTHAGFDRRLAKTIHTPKRVGG
jgi:hypothetical protein